MIDSCFLTTQGRSKSEYNGKILEFTFKIGPIVYSFQNKTSYRIKNVKTLAGQLIFMNQPRFSSGVQFLTYNNVLKYSTHFNTERE